MLKMAQVVEEGLLKAAVPQVVSYCRIFLRDESPSCTGLIANMTSRQNLCLAIPQFRANSLSMYDCLFCFCLFIYSVCNLPYIFFSVGKKCFLVLQGVCEKALTVTCFSIHWFRKTTALPIYQFHGARKSSVLPLNTLPVLIKIVKNIY